METDAIERIELKQAIGSGRTMINMFHEHFTGDVPLSGHIAIKQEHKAIEETIHVCNTCMRQEKGINTCMLDAIASMLQHDIQEIVLILFLIEQVSQEEKDTSGWKRLWGM
jgi:hypothetical protein